MGVCLLVVAALSFWKVWGFWESPREWMVRFAICALTATLLLPFWALGRLAERKRAVDATGAADVRARANDRQDGSVNSRPEGDVAAVAVRPR